MGNEDHRLARRFFREVFHQLRLGGGIQRGTELVQQEDAARAEEPPGDGDALCLAFAQARAPFPASRVQPVGKFKHEIRHGGPQGVHHLGFRRLGIAHEEVFPDGSAEEGVPLRDIDEVAAGGGRGVHFPDGIIEGDGALDRLQESQHRSLADGASLYAAFEGDADDALKTVKKVFPVVHVLRRDKKTAVFRCTRKGPLAKYRDFSSEWTASVPGGEPLVFTSLPGCFCHRRADPGGLALAEVVSKFIASPEFSIPNSQFSILDMGCGCGLVGLLVADAMRRRSGSAPQLTLVDSHARAIAAARINAARLGLEEHTRFVLSDDGLPRGEVATHDLFVGNPPYYSEYKIAEIFLSTAYRALRPGGQCFTVVKTATGLKALQEKYFRTVEIIPRRGYAVLRSVR